jgi:hypothetical protein
LTLNVTNLSITAATGALVLANGMAPSFPAESMLTCQFNAVGKTAQKQAPNGVVRVSRYVLQVRTINGPRRFVDKPPHGPLSGLHWRYCGYDANAKAHLIGMSKDSLFSGKLLFEVNGKLIGAGHTVLFSPDRQEFLAIEQEDGMDGELWSIYDTGGKAKWSGFAGTLKRVDGVDSVESTFDHPHWNRQSQLSARFACTASTLSGTVTLTRNAGNWNWSGKATCLE